MFLKKNEYYNFKSLCEYKIISLIFNLIIYYEKYLAKTRKT